MRKKLPLIILIITIFVQICVPSGLILFQKIELMLVEKNGEIYTLNGTNLSYHNGELRAYLLTTGGENRYIIINTDDNGNIYFSTSETKPEGDNYIDRNNDRYDGKTFPVVQKKIGNYKRLNNIILVKQASVTPLAPDGNCVYYKNVTADIYVYKGRIVLSDIYIDGTDSATYIEKLNEYYS